MARAARQQAADREAQQRQRQRQQQQQQSRSSGGGSIYEDDGVRVGTGGDKVAEAALAEKQNARIRDLRQSELRKAKEASDIASVQKRIDMEVDRWASSKDLRTMLATMPQIWPQAGAIASQVRGGDTGGIKKSYMKALRLVHPDKVDTNANVRTKAMAQRLFTTLQQHKP